MNKTSTIPSRPDQSCRGRLEGVPDVKDGRTKNARTTPDRWRLSFPAEFSLSLDTLKPLGEAIELRPCQRLESVAAGKQKRNTAYWIWRSFYIYKKPRCI